MRLINIFNEIIVIGLGGNFILRYFLGFLLTFVFPEKFLKLVDGGTYKAKHYDHEHFLRLGLKAPISKLMLMQDFPKLKVLAVPYFIGKEISEISRRVSDVIHDGCVVFLCVDNNATKKLVSLFCMNLKNVILISGGIEGADIHVQIYVKINGKEITPPIHTTNPYVMNPDDELPSDVRRRGCIENIEADRPNVFSLMMASALCLSAYCSVLDHIKSGKIENYDVKDIFFNVIKLKMREVHLNSK